MQRKMYALFAFGMALGLLFASADASAQGFGHNRIRVFGPELNNQRVIEAPSENSQFNFRDEDGDGICDSFNELNGARQFGGMMGGRGHGNWRHGGHGHFGNIESATRNHFGPLLEEGQIQLTATVTEVQELMFSVLNGAFVIDASEAELQYVHWFSIDDPDQEVVIEAGQRVSLVGEIVETDEGAIIKALTVRVMDDVHRILDEDEGGIRGVVDSIDLDAGELILSGIPIRINETTLIRSRLTDKIEVQSGDSAAVHVKLFDSDGDELVDSLFAESIRVLPNN
ncbi:MAG: hypothetical protein P9L94_13775 [Candidatus Hinthialibacter antarcticus]|nr:hypothetical protein [Candidatus Hinthialibacter antarcticus]